MGTTVRSVTVKLKADISDFNRQVLGAAAAAKTLPDSLATSAAKARTTLSSLEIELRKIASSRYDATVVLEDAEAAARLDALNVRLDKFGSSVSDARVGVDDGEAVAKISGIEASLLALAHTTADPNIDLQGVARAEAQIAALELQLHSIGGGTGGRGGLGGFIDGLDDSNSRMSNLIQYAVALGPALIPVLGGATVGALALGESLTVAAAGAGVAALALKGVGAGLEALNKYQMDPTQANLDALRLKLEALGPAGQNFVFFLDDLKPKLAELNSTAEAGFLPGLQKGISQVMESFPAINSLVGDLSSTLGDLAAEGGAAFQSPFWQGFLADFSANASAELSKFAEGIGNVTTGLAGMFQAFMPVSSDFTTELLRMSQEFSQWGQTLSDNQGFQDFVTYIRDNGPHAAEALGAIAEALIAIIRAGAPVGSIVLPIITDLARALSAIADSPAGPVLFGIAAAMAALARSLAVMRALNSGALIGGIATLGGAGMTQAAARMQLLAGGVAALVLSLSSLDDKAGVSNTLMGGALGFAVRGGWGAAIGGAIGLTKDLAAANDDLESSMSNVNTALESQTGNFLKADREAIQGLRDSFAAYQADLHGADGKWFSTDIHDIPAGLTAIKTHISDLFTDTSNEGQQAVDDATARLAELQSAWTDFAHAVGGDKSDIAEISAALVDMGYSAKFIQDALTNRNTSSDAAVLWEQLVHGVQDYTAAADAVPARTAAVNQAIADLDNQLVPAAQSATSLKDALDALFGPAMDLTAASDAWTVALRGLNDQLAEHSRELFDNSAGAIKNRAAVADMISALEDSVVAGAGANESSAEFTARLQRQYYALVHQATQLGFNRKEFQRYLATQNLTPREIATLVKLYGTDEAKKHAKDVVAAYNELPKKVRTDIAANGIPADATVKSLMEKYDGLSRKQVETILEARDNASLVIRGVLAYLAQADGKTATSTINVNTVYHSIGVPGFNPGTADGGIYERFERGGFHTGGLPPIGAQQPQIQPNRGKRGIRWAEEGAGPWEAFISGHPDKHDRSVAILAETANRLGMAVQAKADGGIGIRGSVTSAGRTADIAPLVAEIRNLYRMLDQNGISLRDPGVWDDRSDLIARGVVKEYRAKDTRLGAGLA